MMHLSRRRHGRLSRPFLVSALALVFFLPGCGGGANVKDAPEAANAAEALTSLRVLRENLADGQGELFALAETLRAATAPQDLALGPWFNRFREQREGVRSLAMALREGYENLQVAERAYIQKWENDLGAISDPELRQQSVDRRATLRDRFGQLDSDLDDSKQAFRPLLQKLSDLEVYLQNDLTATGVQQVSGRLETAGGEAETLGRKVSADLAKLDALINELAPRKG